ncbi:GntR family transcriptional regulator [Pedobacter frigoris]|uniref:GntR family transcriptional regulator n=2 Tax=Pedobacter frigoris TaxID=2571272 RepID=A0A4U1CCE5_9SPHI|nr:GntR family transcriptional regulator [Pedobacter frigoris]
MKGKISSKTIYDTLKDQIHKDRFPAGSMLPAELTLAQKYLVSRPTIAKVYNQLQDEGLVLKTKGLGTVVTHQHANTNHTFGLLLPGAGESEIFSIINDQLLGRSETGSFNCLWEGATAGSAEIRESLIESCCESYINKRVDGIFFSPLERVPDADELNLKICEAIQEANIPLILIDRNIRISPDRRTFDVVSIDNFNAGSVMAKHLLDQGCEELHFFYRPDSASSIDLRISGVRDLVQKQGHSFTTNNLFCGNPEDLDFVKKMKITPGKTGIICANDSTAAVLMSSLDAQGVEISSDVLVCGYDDMKYSKHLKHSLTSLRQPCEEIANISIELMMRRLKDNSHIPITVNLSGEIVIRESSQFQR